MRRAPLLLLLLLAGCGRLPAPLPAWFRPVDPGPVPTAVAAARRAALAGGVTRMGVTDPRIFEAFRQVDRRVFLPRELWARAWDDRALRRPDGETVTAPDLTGAMLLSLDLASDARVLECGTRSGWLTALLARLAAEVHTVDPRPAAVESARRAHEILGLRNIRYHVADPMAGWPEAGPFDAIVVNGRVDHIPAGLYRDLKPGGRILAPVGPAGEPQTLILAVRGEREPVKTRALLTVRFAPLK